MSLHPHVPQLKKMLQNAGRWLDEAVAFAEKKKFDANTLLQARLAPDQYPLVRQVQAFVDNAKFIAARLAGKEAPKHPDTETTIAELKARLDGTIAFLDTITEADFKGAETRMVALPFMPGKGMLGAEYLVEMALPNFYFHLVSAYSILRHNGVDLGKMQYIGSLTLKDL